MSGLNMHAQYVTLPDTIFANWLKTHGYNQCFIGNQFDTTCPAVLNATLLNCKSLRPIGVWSIEGVQYFKNLDTLNCYGDSLVSLPALPSKLKILSCSDNFLESLPPLPNTIHGLFCEFNKLTILPQLPDSIERLTCHDNQLTEIPNFPRKLLVFLGSGNNLTGLPVLPDTITEFDCYDNRNLFCLPRLTKIGRLNFQGTGVSCVPNYGEVAISVPSIQGMPLCDSANQHDCEFYALGLKEIREMDFSLYPNPAYDKLVVNVGRASSSSLKVIVTDISGQALSQQTINAATKNELDVSGLPAGLYFIEVKNGADLTVRKFVKM